MAPNRKQKPKVGIVTAFTGHYTSVQVVARFLELSGLTVVKSRATTPAILEAGTTLASADFCLPLRVYVGHVHHLIRENPGLDAIVAPNLLSEDKISSTCSKYRDIGGAALRSLGDTVGYLLSHHDPGSGRRLAALVGDAAISARVARSAHLPRLITPDIRSLDRDAMRNLCYNIYAEIMGWSPARKAAFFVPHRLRPALVGALARLQRAADQAYRELVEQRGDRLAALLADPTRPRLAVVGRRYMTHDPALTCDLRPWFIKQGVTVITAADVPPALLRADYAAAQGFYDTHKEGEAFIRWAIDKVDGFISLGSFGCHPDAFQIDYLAELARSLGAPCWTFRFDESAGSAGFFTRFETIKAFLAQRRDQRLAQTAAAAAAARPAAAAAQPAAPEPAPAPAPPTAARPRPVIVWPYFGEILNLLVEEACHQLGLAAYMSPPAPLDTQTLQLGNTRYSESCSPYACSTGSLKQTLNRLLDNLEQAAAKGQKPEPRRIIVLMARGEGPCTFGWYAIVQHKHLPAEFRQRLEAGGHSLEMITMGLDGVIDTVGDLCRLGHTRRLQPVLDFVSAWEKGFDQLSWPRRTWLRLRLFRTLGKLMQPLWAKLDAAERVRARALILRAHELRPGSITRAYHEALALLRAAHSPAAIAAAERQALAILEAVPRDNRTKPRVVTVGEIYVALTSFANRGAVENLLAREGVEVVEGTTLGSYIRSTLAEMKRRSWRNKPWLRPVLAWLQARNVDLLQQRIRSRKALPFLTREVGGEGLPTVGHARELVEAGCDGIVHLYPFKCMPEGLAKDAVQEMADLFGVRYLSLSFDKETEIERLRTEVSTFAAILHAQLARDAAGGPKRHGQQKRQEIRRRQAIGRCLTALDRARRRGSHLN